MESMALVDMVLAARSQAMRAQVDTAIMRKSLDVMKAQGEAVVEMIDQAAELFRAPHAQTPGMGAAIDVVA